MTNKKYHLILVGLGRVADKHIKAFYHLQRYFSGVTLIDLNEDSCAAFAERNKSFLPAAYNFAVDLESYLQTAAMRQLTAERRVIVGITTPSNLHFTQAKIALTHHCHCLIEKPLTLNIKEAEELINLSHSSGCQVAVGHIYRYFPFVRQLHEKLEQGLIGEIISAQLRLDWGHPQTYYDQAAWRGRYRSDGGVLLNQSIHALDLLFYLLNSEFAHGTCYLAQLNHQMEAEDYAACLIEDSRLRQINLICSTATLPEQHKAMFSLVGKKGDLTIGMHNHRLYLSYHNATGKNCTLKLLLSLLKNLCNFSMPAFWHSWFNPHQAIYYDIISKIGTSSPCTADVVSATAALKAVLSLYKAAKDKKYDNSESLAAAAEMQNYFREN